MAILKKFKAHIKSCSYFSSKGMQVAFINGEFITGNEDLITELEAEVKNGHPHIYVDANDAEVDTEALSPLEVIRQQAYEQAKEDLLRQMMENRDFGNHAPNPFAQSLANSGTVSEAVDGTVKTVEVTKTVEAEKAPEAPVISTVTLSPIETLKAKAAEAAKK
jgi:hypothetical protein